MTFHPISMRLKADLVLFIISMIWGSAFVAQRLAGQIRSVFFFNGARYLLAALVVLPFAIRAARFVKKDNPNTPRGQYIWIFIEGLLLFMASALQQAGMVYTTAGNAGFITSLYVVLVPVVLFLFWHEKSHWISIVAMILAAGGGFLLSTAGKFEAHIGDILELIGALFWTIHIIILGKVASKFEAISFSGGQLVICAALNMSLGIFCEPIPLFSWSFMFGIAYTGILALGLCFTLQIWAQRHTSPADAALVLSLESVFSILAGWLFLNEKLSPIQILGCSLIFTAVLLSQSKEYNYFTNSRPAKVESETGI